MTHTPSTVRRLVSPLWLAVWLTFFAAAWWADARDAPRPEARKIVQEIDK